MRLSWSAITILGAALLGGCFDTGKSDDDDDDGGGDGGGGWDLGDDTGAGGGGDGGGGDGGSGDGGGDGDSDTDTDTDTDTDSDTDADTDTDTDTDTDADVDTGILVYGATGEATVRPEVSYDGWEEIYYEGYGPDISCRIYTQVTAVEVLDSCDACVWAFTIEASDGVFTSTNGCASVGVTDESAFDGLEYQYGLQEDYGSFGDVLSYYFSGYGWYPVAYADYDGRNFSYDWPIQYYYYYRY